MYTYPHALYLQVLCNEGAGAYKSVFSHKHKYACTSVRALALCASSVPVYM
jgi:hypothetical protein